jgi:hypothetical protein
MTDTDSGLVMIQSKASGLAGIIPSCMPFDNESLDVLTKSGCGTGSAPIEEGGRVPPSAPLAAHHQRAIVVMCHPQPPLATRT